MVGCIGQILCNVLRICIVYWIEQPNNKMQNTPINTMKASLASTRSHVVIVWFSRPSCWGADSELQLCLWNKTTIKSN